MSDPNFPPSLNIHPLDLRDLVHAHGDQEQAIAKYGIAGRVWEASRPLIHYFTPDLQPSFDPPCPIFDHTNPKRILELGSGQALASLHLSQYLRPADHLMLTDLPNVVPLCQRSVERWESRQLHSATVEVTDLAWGSDCAHVQAQGPYDYILMCDLIYFPHLYPSLLYTLLQLTEEGLSRSSDRSGPIVILSYFSRTLALEESFFQAFGQYFEMTPVSGNKDDAKIYLCRRWPVNDAWVMPTQDKVMSGGKGILRGRDFGLVDELFASIEY